jgi:hypothetical protein
MTLPVKLCLYGIVTPLAYFGLMLWAEWRKWKR